MAALLMTMSKRLLSFGILAALVAALLSTPSLGPVLSPDDAAAEDLTGAGAGIMQFSAATYTVSEPGPTATITVTRTGGSTGTVRVSYATGSGTATPGSDYVPVSGTLTWGPGDTAAKTFTVLILDDTRPEAFETVKLALSGPTGGATVGSPSIATLTIADNDQPDFDIQYFQPFAG